VGQGKPWTKGDGDNKKEPIQSCRKEGTRKPKRGHPNSIERDADQMESLEGHQGSGSWHEAIRNPAIHVVESSHGDET